MRIAYVTAGAGGMICGTCLHDNALAAALSGLGHDAALVPTYTPLRTDEPAVAMPRVFYGALNVYLQQLSGVFRRLPGALDRLLDRPGLLARIAKLSASTDPRDLGALTLSVLRGADGNQARELAKLTAWLRDELAPDVVHLNNSLFAGLARELRGELGVPVVCSLQGEDLFLDQLREPWRARVAAALRERAADVDAFVAPSRWYAEHMAERLGVPPARVAVVPLGINLAGHGGEAGEREAGAGAGAEGRPPTVGYLARLCPEKGLHLLVEAFRRLAAERPGGLRLRVAGYLAPRDRPWLRALRRDLEDAGLSASVDFAGELDREGKVRFLRSLDILALPTTYREPKGLPVLEALANGVPVVVPRHGSFPELLADTGGGLLVEPGSAVALADGIRSLLDEPARRRELGRRGRDAVRARRSAAVEAEATVAVYRRLLAARTPAAALAL